MHMNYHRCISNMMEVTYCIDEGHIGLRREIRE